MTESLWSTRTRSILSALVLTTFLCLGFKSESLWTDEAFSAYMACHRSLASLWHTLYIGDSSDLQMWLYYSYLHVWVNVFGSEELALRAANVPFIVLYSVTIVWTRNHLFRSDWVWLAALNPFVWAYAADARPYMSIISLSTVFVVALLASINDSRHANSRALPWIALCSLLIGLNFHMLCLLLVPPCLLLILVYRLTTGAPIPWKPWLRPASFFAPLFGIYFAYLAWTFRRGTSYDYAHPDLLSTGSVLFRFIGLSGFAPNRHYNVSFGPYVPEMAMAALLICGAAISVIVPALKALHPLTLSLAAALGFGICEILILTFVVKQQIEVRHVACLFVLFLFLCFSAWEFPTGVQHRQRAMLSALLIGVIWLGADFRLAFLSEYDREDFRDAVADVIKMARSENAEVAVVADPAAAAYYGLSMDGKSPCFPLPGTCQQALALVNWPHYYTAMQATFWPRQQIIQWLEHGQGSKSSRVLLISRSRHPMYLESPWWSVLRNTRSYRMVPFHGFFVYTSRSEKY